MGADIFEVISSRDGRVRVWLEHRALQYCGQDFIPGSLDGRYIGESMHETWDHNLQVVVHFLYLRATDPPKRRSQARVEVVLGSVIYREGLQISMPWAYIGDVEYERIIPSWSQSPGRALQLLSVPHCQRRQWEVWSTLPLREVVWYVKIWTYVLWPWPRK